MLHKKNISILFVAVTMISINHNTLAMDPNAQNLNNEKEQDLNNEKEQDLNNKKEQAKIDLLKKKLEKEERKVILTADLNAKKALKLQTEIDQMNIPNRIGQGMIEAVKDGVAGTISTTGQYYFKRQIDLWMDGSLTTAELLAELNAREEYLGKQLINIKQTADSYRNFLNESERITFNQETKEQLKNIQIERTENNRLYKELVAKKRNQQN